MKLQFAILFSVFVGSFAAGTACLKKGPPVPVEPDVVIVPVADGSGGGDVYDEACRVLASAGCKVADSGHCQDLLRDLARTPQLGSDARCIVDAGTLKGLHACGACTDRN